MSITLTLNYQIIALKMMMISNKTIVDLKSYLKKYFQGDKV